MLINDDLWLTQELIAELFGTARSTVTEHIHNIFKDGELSEKTSVGISDESSGGREYMTKGFVLDDERLKNAGNLFGKDYFRELLERIRSIRASERRIWQQVMGLTTWKHAPNGRILKSEVPC